MTNSNINFKTFLLNAIDYLTFGFRLIKNGVCDKRIDGEYKLIENCENKGYTKEEASNLLNISVRQFDRRVKFGYLPAGKKYRDDKRLYWDKKFIDNMSVKIKQ